MIGCKKTQRSRRFLTGRLRTFESGLKSWQSRKTAASTVSSLTCWSMFAAFKKPLLKYPRALFAEFTMFLLTANLQGFLDPGDNAYTD